MAFPLIKGFIDQRRGRYEAFKRFVDEATRREPFLAPNAFVDEAFALQQASRALNSKSSGAVFALSA